VDVVRYENDRGAHRAESILQNVLVLASGQVFTRAEERSLSTRTVTLAVTPEQVDVLVAARAKGTLSLALRGVNDHEVMARPKPAPVPSEAEDARWKAAEEHRAKLERELAELKSALAAKAAPPPAPAAAPAPPSRPPVRHVHIYRGGRSPDRIPLDGAVAAETAGRRPDPTPGLDPAELQGLTGTVPGAGARQSLDATALIRRFGESARPGS
jgi:pilus assembly protein CpaB